MKIRFIYKGCFLIILWLGIVFLTSCNSQNSENDGSVFEDGFELYPTFVNGKLFFQYLEYYFESVETRNVIIGGPYNTNTVYLRYSSPSGDDFKYSIGNGTNQFAGTKNNYSYFIMAIPITSLNDFDDWSDVVFKAEDANGNVEFQTSSTFPLNMIKINNSDERMMKVHYTYLSNCNILNTIPSAKKDEIVNAFNESNTELVLLEDVLQPITNPSMEDITLIEERNKLLAWFKTVLLPADGISIKNIQYVIGMDDFVNSNGTLGNQTGVTVSEVSSIFDGNEYRDIITTYSVVWKARVTAVSNTSISVDQIISRTTTHELAHGRGHMFDGWPYPNGLTDATHTKGHDGNNKKICALNYINNMTNDEIFASFEKPHFCEGHIQMLLNTNWTEEDYYYE